MEQTVFEIDNQENGFELACKQNGFYMTSLSVLYGSKYVKSLYNEIDPKKQTQPKIHTLKAYFINSAHWALMCIVLSMQIKSEKRQSRVWSYAGFMHKEESECLKKICQIYELLMGFPMHWSELEL
ncbi:hypothetical protein [Helicobacter sp. 13S00482-2]|uniref:hypothetical protein n=1 Tax=Helicobacter sp. 13S00482-2 TaxID=1476200 RepID=UPI001C5E555A|nr:hypothetical protein [Helicobacter sp. 13S00482-2]